MSASTAVPTARPHLRIAPFARAAAAVLTVVLVTGAGLGWLYLLRRTGTLAAGPRLHEALPLERLAGRAAQPLGRLVAAWLPAGLAGGAVLWAVGLRPRLWRAVVVFAGCGLLLLAFGAASDAVTASEPLRGHLGAQPGRTATWVAAALAGAGAALPGRLPRRR